MAIVRCLHCGARTSSKAGRCGTCGKSVSEDAVRARAEHRARAGRRLARRLAMQAVLATLLAVAGGFWLMFGAAPRAGGLARTTAVTMLAVGAVWYVYVRARLWLQRRG